MSLSINAFNIPENCLEGQWLSGLITDEHYLNQERSSGERWKPQISESTTDVAQKIIQKLKVNQEHTFITTARKEEVSYPLYRRVLWIHVPKNIAFVINHFVFKLLGTVTVFGLVYLYLPPAIVATTQFITARAIPLIINNTPIQVIRMFNQMITLAIKVRDHFLEVILTGVLLQAFCYFFPETFPRLTHVIEQLNPVVVLASLKDADSDFVRLTCELFFDIFFSVWNGFAIVASQFEQIALIERKQCDQYVSSKLAIGLKREMLQYRERSLKLLQDAV